MQPQAGWYQDPTGRNQLRYWDGSQWTTHVSNNGVMADEAAQPQAPPASYATAGTSTHQPYESGGSATQPSADAGQGQPPAQAGGFSAALGAQPSTSRVAGIDPTLLKDSLAKAEVQPRSGDGTLTGEPVLVVARTADEKSAYRYHICSASGQLLAVCATEGATDANASSQRGRTDHFQLRGPNGNLLGRLIHRRPQPLEGFFSLVGQNGTEIAQVQQKNAYGRFIFHIVAGEKTVAMLYSPERRARLFWIVDAKENKLANLIRVGPDANVRLFGRSTKAAGPYVVDLPQRQPEPLASVIPILPIVVDLSLEADPSV